MKKTIKNSRMIYLDHASSALFRSANPGAIHELGLKEKNKLARARIEVARILDAHPEEIIFTSGATESNNLAIQGIIHLTPSPLSLIRRGVGERFLPHIVTTNIEHASVLQACKHLEKTKQATVTYVEVEPNGVVDPKKIKKALQKNTILVSVMYANNEIGTVQPIVEIAKEIRHYKKINSQKIFFHTDATQAVNYLPIRVSKLGIDLMSFNSAKIYGPKGIGVLYVKKNTPVGSIMFGGDQEFGLRPGTENVTLAVEFTKALQNTEKIKDKEVKRLIKLRDYFITKLSKVPFDIVINGDLKDRLPNNVNITITKIPSDLLVIELSARGIMASAKSACKSGDGKASHVIKAVNPKAKDTDGSLRFSLGQSTTKKDLDDTVQALSQILTKLKKWYS